MAIDKSMTNNGPFSDPILNTDPNEPFEVETTEEPYPTGETLLEDGSVEISMGDEPEEVDVAFDANLAEVLDENDLNAVAQLITEKVDIDIQSRQEWETVCKNGLKLLGFEHEERTTPFKGSCGISHPVLAEAVVRFQSQALTEIFPAQGPCQHKIVGKSTPAKLAQGLRVEEYMNHLLTEEMEDYRDETDRLLFCLPLFGSVFKKVCKDPLDDLPSAVMIEAEDLIVPYGTSALKKSTRITHRFRQDKVWIQKMQEVGFYRECELGGSTQLVDPIREEKDKVDGVTGISSDSDLYTLYECHIYLSLEEKLNGEEPEADAPELPYVVTMDRDSQKVLAIRRNWIEDDPRKKRREHFVDYKYIPGTGFYGYGLAHLIGGLTAGATSIIRQLVDAGTFANLPGGFKSKDMRITADKTPIAPGEWRDVDTNMGKIQDNVLPLPYKEPSATLQTLMVGIIEEARRFASLTDMNIANASQEAPVGTTLAIIERNMKVMTAIQSRIHASLKRELKLIAGCIRDYGPENYPYEVEDGATIKADFDAKVDVIPVADPNSSTQAQRIMQAQAALQISQMGSPEGVDMKKLKRYAMDVMGVPNAKDILPLDEDLKPMDPVSENMSILTLGPVKAFQHQDHDAHIQVHMLAVQDPSAQQILQTAPQAQAIFAAMMAHVTEHLAMKYRNEIERNLGVQLPPQGAELPEDVEGELSRMVAQAADKLFRENRRAEEARIIEEERLDPVAQTKKAELEIKRIAAISQAEERDRRFNLDLAKEVKDGEQRERELDQDYEINTAKVRIQAISEVLFGLGQMESISSQERQKAVEMIMKLSDKGQKEARDRVKD